MNNKNELTPIILAGGKGTRLRSVVSDRPKVLAPVNNKPFITYILNQLIKEEFNQVILSIGYMGDMIREVIGDKYGGMEILYFKENTPLGTGGAIKNIAKTLKCRNLLVMNGDTFHNIKKKNYLK